MRARAVLTWAILACATAVLVAELTVLSDPSRGRPDDFVAFWASARVLRTGGNPYDPAPVLAVQRSANWTEPHPYRVWEPPWVFPLLLPFAGVSYQLGRALWFVLNLIAITAAADVVWRTYGGTPARRGIAWLLPLLFAPTAIAWRTGQITGLVLLGIALFLWWERRGRDALAGAALALAGVKPHVIYLVWPALLYWTAVTRRWRVLAGGIVAGAVLTAIALAYRPSLLADAVTVAAFEPPRQGASTLGTVFRLASRGLVGEDFYGLIFVAPAAGLTWVAARALRRRASWCWRDELPTLVLVALATAPFAWIYDEVVAVVPLVQVAALWSAGGVAPRRALLAGLATFDVAVMAMNLARVDPFWYVWTPFALLALYAGAAPPAPVPTDRALRVA